MKFHLGLWLAITTLVSLASKTHCACKTRDASWSRTVAPIVRQASPSDPETVVIDWRSAIKNARCVDVYHVKAWKQGQPQNRGQSVTFNKTAVSARLTIEPCIDYNFAVEYIEKDWTHTDQKTSRTTRFKTEAVPAFISQDRSNFLVGYAFEATKHFHDLSKASIRMDKRILRHPSCVKHIEVSGREDSSISASGYQRSMPFGQQRASSIGGGSYNQGQGGSAYNPGGGSYNQGSHGGSSYNPGSSQGGGSFTPGGSSNHPGGGGSYQPGGSSNGGGGSYQPGGSSNGGGSSYNPGGSSSNPGDGGSFSPSGRSLFGYGGSYYNPGGSFYNPGGGGLYNPGAGLYNPGNHYHNPQCPPGGQLQYPGYQGNPNCFGGRPGLYPEQHHNHEQHSRPDYKHHGRYKRERMPSRSTTSRPSFSTGQVLAKVTPPFYGDVIEAVFPVKPCTPYRFTIKIISPRNAMLGQIDNLVLPKVSNLPDYHPPPMSKLFKVDKVNKVTLNPNMGVPATCLEDFFHAIDNRMAVMENRIQFHIYKEFEARGHGQYLEGLMAKQQSEQLVKFGCQCNSPFINVTTTTAKVISYYPDYLGVYNFDGMYNGRPYYRKPSRLHTVKPLVHVDPHNITSNGHVSVSVNANANAAQKLHFIYWSSANDSWYIVDALGSKTPKIKTMAKSRAKCPADPANKRSWQYSGTLAWKSDANLHMACLS